MPFDQANYILGHQTVGLELFNPFTTADSPGVFRAFRELTVRLAGKLAFAVEGWEDE